MTLNHGLLRVVRVAVLLSISAIILVVTMKIGVAAHVLVSCRFLDLARCQLLQVGDARLEPFDALLLALVLVVGRVVDVGVPGSLRR